MTNIDHRLLKLMKEKHLSETLFRGNFGLEKENNRVHKNGTLALTPHPSSFGDRAKHPYITTDFSESQIEMVTPVFPTIDEAFEFLENIHDIVSLELSKQGEYLWPGSNPPILPDECLIPIAKLENDQETEYRYKLAQKYGRKKQLISGIHYNFSFSDELLHVLYDEQSSHKTYKEFKNDIYLKISRNFNRYRDLLVDVTGASPVFHNTYNQDCVLRAEQLNQGSYYLPQVHSFRNSVCGYKNRKDYQVSYQSVEEYVEDIHNLIQKHELLSAKEYYHTLRLKAGAGEDPLQGLLDKGIQYIEIRLLDLNPLFKIGTSKENLYFIHLFILYMLLLEEEEKTDLNYLSIIAGMKEMARELSLADKYIHILVEVENMLIDPELSYAARIKEGIKQSSYELFHMKHSFDYLHESEKHSFTLLGYEDMELSTQILIKDAIKRGIGIEIVDRDENFIALSDGKKTEYVKQATKTSLDSYSTVLVMENKLVTKKILRNAGMRVPNGGAYQSLEEAVMDYEKYKAKQIVIKPKSTNFGLGITIFKDSFSKEDYEKALGMAFLHDRTVLVEEFLSGKEYRFLVMGDEVTGILHRVPANVKGDGQSSIAELVKAKNKDPLRGKGYKTPLEKIQLGESEALFLKGQGKDFDYIPAEGELVYLRENSNISTGGDSLDLTDAISGSYKELAIQAAKAAGATICGVDMMIDDPTANVSEQNYGIIELNFNPAIHIHCYPYKGENRRAGERILQLLFGK
ncbi:bifunctional glutamate--cysteine ligase GshA/glutathione synthetase GshB [Bacillus sp. E214]|uniref:bifunctional glutamate--cysteine ligase GshA/glutathione synthetase GshB n=1 Tax=Bacillus sp. E214 TaxID=2587156 RepID=UPI0011E01FC0|nr:bifunctional glutamate--cysteine ligase GshA/glutathione synthetase GshB [Bacillus sp. E214]